MNKIIVIGNLGRDPELTYTANGRAVAKFSLAENRRWTNRETGEKQSETTWFNVVGWERMAELCAELLHKGSKVFVEGRMTARKYTDKDGNKREAWELVLTDMQLLDTKPSTAEEADDSI